MRICQYDSFVQVYLIIMRSEKETIRAKMASHLEELMGDAKLYGWNMVRVYHEYGSTS